jgi:hypothetical protein
MPSFLPDTSDTHWGSWVLNSDLKLVHQETNYTADITETTTADDLLKLVFISSSVLSKHALAEDIAYLLLAIRTLFNYSDLSMRELIEFDGYKIAKKYYTHVVNRRKVNNSTRITVLKRDRFKCVYCGASAKENAVLHVDHIIPISKGGSNELHNLQTLCRECNNGKSDQIIEFCP